MMSRFHVGGKLLYLGRVVHPTTPTNWPCKWLTVIQRHRFFFRSSPGCKVPRSSHLDSYKGNFGGSEDVLKCFCFGRRTFRYMCISYIYMIFVYIHYGLYIQYKLKKGQLRKPKKTNTFFVNCIALVFLQTGNFCQ